jgi:hypothetical protein
MTGPDTTTVYFPYGGNLLIHGYDVSTLTSSDWTGGLTSITFDAINAGMYDTLMFKDSTGRVLFLSLVNFGGSGSSSAVANLVGEYGCPV